MRLCGRDRRGERPHVRLAPQSLDLFEIEPRGCEQVGTVVVLALEDAPDEREPVRVRSD